MSDVFNIVVVVAAAAISPVQKQNSQINDVPARSSGSL